MPPGVAVGERRDAERTGVRGHVEAIREQRHRAGSPAGEYLYRHHSRRQTDDVSGPFLVRVVGLAKKAVIVDMFAALVVMHGRAGLRGRVGFVRGWRWFYSASACSTTFVEDAQPGEQHEAGRVRPVARLDIARQVVPAHQPTKIARQLADRRRVAAVDAEFAHVRDAARQRIAALVAGELVLVDVLGPAG